MYFITPRHIKSCNIIYTHAVWNSAFQRGFCRRWILPDTLITNPRLSFGYSSYPPYIFSSYQLLGALLKSSHIETTWDISSIANTTALPIYSVSKKITPSVFWHFFPNGWQFLVQILHTYYTLTSTLDYKFLSTNLQFWRSYAILSATTQRAFQPMVDIFSI